MKILLLTLLLFSSLQASQQKIEKFSYEFLQEDEEFPEETMVKISFEMEVQDIITILEKQIAMIEMYADNLLIKGHAVNSSMHYDILLIELRDCMQEIKSLKEIKHRLEYYLTVANHSILE